MYGGTGISSVNCAPPLQSGRKWRAVLETRIVYNLISVCLLPTKRDPSLVSGTSLAVRPNSCESSISLLNRRVKKVGTLDLKSNFPTQTLLLKLSLKL